MKSILLILLTTLSFLVGHSQVYQIDFGNTTGFFSCDPPVYTTTGQSQCVSINPVATPIGSTIMYYTTSAEALGADCRNWLRLSDPGFSFIGIGSELQLRNAGNGSTPFNPARFLVKDFTPGTKFAISFDVALAGYGGAYYFRCGSGQAYGDTMFMLSRDSSSFMVMKIDGTGFNITQPSLRYSSSLSNTFWPNVPSYNWVPGINSSFPVYQKHTIAIFCNNTNTASNYFYLNSKTLNPQSYDVYLDSTLDVDNMFDDFFGLNRQISSFMFCGSDAMCANGGPYLGDTVIVDNIRWSSDFVIYPMPIKLSSFTARIVGDKQVQLNWRDETPSDQNKFDIQMSTDGIHFYKIGSVTGRADLNNYSFIYKGMNYGKIFFRLAFEGKYSDTRVVDLPCSGTQIIAGKQSITISTKVPGTLSIMNIFGQALSKVIIATGYSQIPVIVPPGIYAVQFIGKDGNTFSQKVFIQ